MMTRDDVVSDEELYFYWALQELIDAGYIDKIKYQPKPFPLFDKVESTYQKKLKTKNKIILKTLLREHQYQADFLIGWNDKAKNIFFADINFSEMAKPPFFAYLYPGNESYRSIIDVKGSFNQNDAWRRFSIEQKWVWQNYSLYVQKIIPSKLFKDVFTPKRYMTTDKSGKPRKIAWKTRTLAEYVASK